MADLEALKTAIVAGDRGGSTRNAAEAIADGTDPRTIMDTMTAAMAEVGRRFQANELFVPEMLISARAMKEAMALLEPVLVKADIRPEWTAVVGTIQGDLHDIGKNLVAMMLRGANIKVIDVGTNVPAERFIEAARESNASLIGISALLTTTMTGMGAAVLAIRAAGLPGVKIMVGGAPVTPEFANQIGADAYAPDAASAVDVAKQTVAAG